MSKLKYVWNKIDAKLWGHVDDPQLKSFYIVSPTSPSSTAKKQQERPDDMWEQLLRRHAKGEGTKFFYK